MREKNKEPSELTAKQMRGQIHRGEKVANIRQQKAMNGQHTIIINIQLQFELAKHAETKPLGRSG